jgi:hypothetical protein
MGSKAGELVRLGTAAGLPLAVEVEVVHAEVQWGYRRNEEDVKEGRLYSFAPDGGEIGAQCGRGLGCSLAKTQAAHVGCKVNMFQSARAPGRAEGTGLTCGSCD